MARTHLQSFVPVTTRRPEKWNYCVTYRINISWHTSEPTVLSASNIFQKEYKFLALALCFAWKTVVEQDGLFLAKSLLSHSAVHLVVVSVLRSIGFPSSV